MLDRCIAPRLKTCARVQVDSGVSPSMTTWPPIRRSASAIVRSHASCRYPDAFVIAFAGQDDIASAAVVVMRFINWRHPPVFMVARLPSGVFPVRNVIRSEPDVKINFNLSFGFGVTIVMAVIVVESRCMAVAPFAGDDGCGRGDDEGDGQHHDVMAFETGHDSDSLIRCVVR